MHTGHPVPKDWDWFWYDSCNTDRSVSWASSCLSIMPPHNLTRKEEILRVTDNLFRVGISHELTLDDIAKAAKISKGTIYTYFKDKNDLFHQAELFRMEHLVTRLEDVVQVSDPFERRIGALFHELDDFFSERVPIIGPHQLLNFKATPEEAPRIEKFRIVRGVLLKYIEGIIQQGIEEGDVRPDISPQIAARHMMASVIFRRLTRAVDDQMIKAEDIVPLFLDGITPRGKK